MELKNLIAVMSLAFMGMAFAENASTRVIPEIKPIETKEELRPHVGFLLGAADVTGELPPALIYGADLGIQVYIPFSAGLQVSGFAPNSSLYRISVLGKAAYNFGGDIKFVKSSFVGIKAGAVNDDNGTDSRWRFGLGPSLGFDNTLTGNWTIGLELSYLMVVGPDNPDHWSTVAALKHWFY